MGRIVQMLKTTKEFDFVYKNSFKFRSESLDICVLRANMAGQFYEKFRRLPCNFVGFSVSKKVGNAVERNLVKRRLRAICRECFSVGNSSLTRPSREFEKSLLDRQQVLSHADFSAQPTNLTQDTRIANLDNIESINDSRGSILEIKSGFCETSNEDKTDSLSRKRVEAIHDFSPKDKHANLICIFIAKSQILQTPFSALKSTIFATLKKQMRFMKNSHSTPKMANRYESPKRESNKMANRPQTKAKQNENR